MPSIDPLDLRIARAEQELIDREQRVAQRARALGERLGELTRPRNWLGAGAGLAVIAAVGGWLLRRWLPPVHRPAPVANAAAGAAAPWLGLIAVAWPFLPGRWRKHMSPATATALAGVALPLVQALLKPRHEPLETVATVDLERYAGRWYEIARLPAPFEKRCAGQPRAEYTLRSDGRVAVANRCADERGGEIVAEGVAEAVPDSGNARLRVTFAPAWLRWLPFVWGDYWILQLDPGYRVALVGDPSRRFLWVLARERTIAASVLQPLLQQAEAQGYDVARVISSTHA